jgi:hypothetical protein
VNRDDITRMAQEAGFKPHNNPEMWDITIASDEAIERFFHLAYAAGRKAEQERCCGLIFGWAGSDNVAQRTVDAIRREG